MNEHHKRCGCSVETAAKEVVSALNVLSKNLERIQMITADLTAALEAVDTNVKAINTSFAAFLATVNQQQLPPETVTALNQLQTDVGTLQTAVSNAVTAAGGGTPAPAPSAPPAGS